RKALRCLSGIQASAADSFSDICFHVDLLQRVGYRHRRQSTLIIVDRVAGTAEQARADDWPYSIMDEHDAWSILTKRFKSQPGGILTCRASRYGHDTLAVEIIRGCVKKRIVVRMNRDHNQANPRVSDKCRQCMRQDRSSCD